MVAPSIRNERASPPSSTRVRTVLRKPLRPWRSAALWRTSYATKYGFVDFHDAACAAHWRKAALPHNFTNAMTHEPRGLKGNAQSAMELVGADPLLRRIKQMHRLKPKMQRDMAGFKDGSNPHSERLSAGIAFVEPNTIAG